MKKLLFTVILCSLAIKGFPIVPGYYGARSLSLGYASTAFNYDLNAIYINPSLLSYLSFPLSGYQYQNSYLDYKNFSEDLSDVLEYDLGNFESIGESEKNTLFSRLEDLFRSKAGMYGFRTNVAGFVSRNYGISISFINTAIINPVNAENDIFDTDVADISNEDIAALQMNFLGLKYKKISLSYSMEIYRGVSMGVSLHYLTGKIRDFNSPLVGDVFSSGTDIENYLKYGWESADNEGDKFSKILADLGLNLNLGRYFNVGMVYKNFGSAKIDSSERRIALPKRVTAGIAFKPNDQWGFYLDVDVKKADLLYNGEDMQPISMGIEKGFFKNKFFVRAGMLNDLTEKHFFGKKSNALYGLGLGFNMRKITVDVAVGINGDGSVKNLAISGFFLIK